MQLGPIDENKPGDIGLVTALPPDLEGKLDQVGQDTLFSGAQVVRDEGGFVKRVMANWSGDYA